MASTLPPAPMGADHFDLTKGSPSAAGGNPLLPFFGPPAHGVLATNPYDAYPVTNWDLPKAYEGRNEFLAQTIDSLVTRVDSWQTAVILPWRQTDQINFRWNTFHFDNHLTGRTPEEGTSRLVKVRYSEQEDYAERHGLAMILEHGFFLTPQGRMHFVMNLMQIKAAALETVNYHVIAALLYSKFYPLEWHRRHGSASAHDEVERVVEEEVEDWAIVNKQQNGLQQKFHRMRDRMKDYTLPDAWIFPSRLKMFVTTVGEKNWRYDNGGPARYRNGDLGPDKAAVFPEDDISIFEARTYKVFDRRGAIDLLRYQRTIGEYFLMADIHSGRDLRTYESAWRDIMVHSGDEDVFRRISLKDALKASMRFDPKSGSLSKAHDALATAMGDAGGGEDNDLPLARDLMLWTPTGNDRRAGKVYYPIKYLGQMDLAFLSNETLRSIAESGYTTFDAAVAERIARAAEFLKTLQAQKPLSAFVDAIKTAGSTVSAYGTVPLPSKVEGMTHPAGYASYPGLQEIAANGVAKGWDKNIVAAAADTLDTFNTVYDTYKRIFPDNAFFNTQFQEAHFPIKDAKNVFFSHVFAGPTTPVWGLVGGGAAKKAAAPTAGAKAGAAAKTADDDEVAVSGGGGGGTWTRLPLVAGAGIIAAVKDGSVKGLSLSDPTDHERVIADPASNPAKLDVLARLFGHAGAAASDLAHFGIARALGGGGAKRRMPARDDYEDSAADEDSYEARGTARRRVATSLDDAVEAISGRAASSRIQFRSAAFSAGARDDMSDVRAEISGDYDGARAEITKFGITDVNGLSGNLLHRWKYVSEDTDFVRKMTARLYLGAENTFKTWSLFIDNNLAFPANFVLLRPFQRYWMKSAILLKAGPQTGSTFIGHSDMMLADNATQKLHYGHFTFYFKPVVKRQENIAIAKDLLADGVIGGDGTKFFTQVGVQYDRANARYGADIFACMIGADERQLPTRIDITGAFDAALVKDIDLMDNVDENGTPKGRALHYSSALYYRRLWKWTAMPPPNETEYFGHQQMYDPKTQAFTITHKNQGHWGETVYEGAKKVRNGGMALFTPPHEQKEVTKRY